MHRTTRTTIAVLAAVAVVLVSACSSDESVGSDVKVGGEGGAAALRDSNTTLPDGPATTAPPATAPPSTAAASPDTTAPPTTQPAPENIIKIQDDAEGSYFDPVMYQAPVGAVLMWKNVSSEARSVIADDGSFTSPEIPPGGTFKWKVTGPERVINYTDGTRPYAQAQIQVY